MAKIYLHGNDVAKAAYTVGFRGASLRTAIAVAMAESTFQLNIISPTQDYGLWQINRKAHPKYDFDRLLSDANYNAGAAWDISSKGTRWSPWVAYNSGAYSAHMAAAQGFAAHAESGGGSMTLTPEALIAKARSYIGTTESPMGSNRQIFAAKAGHANGLPWCATFVVACAREVGLKLPSESAATKSMAGAFQAAGKWHAKGIPGDIVFFDFVDSSTGIQHVGIVEGGSGSTYQTIEGNTGGTGGSQDNGGGVYAKSRNVNTIVGFGRPDYDSAPLGLLPSLDALMGHRTITNAALESKVNVAPSSAQSWPPDPKHHALPLWLAKKGLYGKAIYRGSIKRILEPDKYNVNFLYNPSDIEIAYQADDTVFVPEAQETWKEDDLQLTSANTSITFNLLFDRTYEVIDGSNVGVLTDILALERMCGIIPSAPSLKMYPVQIFLGSPIDFVFDAIITDIGIKYSHFSMNMIPMRAGVTISAKRRSRRDSRLWLDGKVPESISGKPPEKKEDKPKFNPEAEANKTGESISSWGPAA